MIGSAGGSISLFNMQSGQHRQSYPRKVNNKFTNEGAGPVRQSNISAKHTKAVTGLAIDSLNRTIVSCDLDGKVKVGFLQIALSPLVADCAHAAPVLGS